MNDVIGLVTRMGKPLLWILAILAAFFYWGASVRAGRPATVGEWTGQVDRFQNAAGYYYGEKPPDPDCREMGSSPMRGICGQFFGGSTIRTQPRLEPPAPTPTFDAPAISPALRRDLNCRWGGHCE